VLTTTTRPLPSLFIRLQHLKIALKNSVDIIGAFSLANPAWKAQVDKDKIPPKEPPPWLKNK